MEPIVKQSILMVEDNPDLQKIVRDYFNSMGMHIETVSDGKTFNRYLLERRFDLILLDLNLPDVDGLELLEEYRRKSRNLLFVVSGRTDTDSKITALELGADDFITKPFSAKELALKVNNALKRQRIYDIRLKGTASNEDMVVWRLRIYSRDVEHVSGKIINLTLGEFALANILCESSGDVLSRSTILTRLEEDARISCPETLTALIYRLRKKFDYDADNNPIQTHKGVGYSIRQGCMEISHE